MSLSEKIDSMDEQIKKLEQELCVIKSRRREFIKNFSEASRFPLDNIMPVLVDLFSVFCGLEKYEYKIDNDEKRVIIIDIFGNIVFTCPYSIDTVTFYFEDYPKNEKGLILDSKGYFTEYDYSKDVIIKRSKWGTSNVSCDISSAIHEFIEFVIFNTMDKKNGKGISVLRELEKKFLISKRELLDKIYDDIEKSSLEELNKKRELRRQYLENLGNN